MLECLSTLSLLKIFIILYMSIFLAISFIICECKTWRSMLSAQLSFIIQAASQVGICESFLLSLLATDQSCDWK